MTDLLILLVDDSPSVRTRLAALLREVSGHDVREAVDAPEALLLLAKETVDVLVLDIHMPGGSGFDVLSHVQKSGASIVTIVLTNDPSETHRRQSLLRGADHFLDKSRDFEEVVAIVAKRAAGLGRST